MGSRYLLGGMVAQQVERWTCDQLVQGHLLFRGQWMLIVGTMLIIVQ